MHEVVFVEDSGGGTNILLKGDPRRLAGPDPFYLEGEPAEAARLTASLLAEQPWIIDNSLGRDELAVAAAVTKARFRGSRLYVIIVSDPLGEAFDGLADSVLDRLGRGTILLIDPEYAGWSSVGDIYTVSELDRALDSALQGSSDEELVERFISSLHSDA